MWRDVFLDHREALVDMLACLAEDSLTSRRPVRGGDAAYIQDKVPPRTPEA